MLHSQISQASLLLLCPSLVCTTAIQVYNQTHKTATNQQQQSATTAISHRTSSMQLQTCTETIKLSIYVQLIQALHKRDTHKSAASLLTTKPHTIHKITKHPKTNQNTCKSFLQETHTSHTRRLLARVSSLKETPHAKTQTQKQPTASSCSHRSKLPTKHKQTQLHTKSQLCSFFFVTATCTRIATTRTHKPCSLSFHQLHLQTPHKRPYSIVKSRPQKHNQQTKTTHAYTRRDPKGKPVLKPQLNKSQTSTTKPQHYTHAHSQQQTTTHASQQTSHFLLTYLVSAPVSMSHVSCPFFHVQTPLIAAHALGKPHACLHAPNTITHTQLTCHTPTPSPL